jgi:hypothetical protein
MEKAMTCTAELITLELWETIKTDLGSEYRHHIERRNLDENFMGNNRIIHTETGNYICYAPVMIRDKSSRWFFYVMSKDVFCFRVDDPTRTMLEFYGNEPIGQIYMEFQRQITEVFGVGGFNLSIPGGWKFLPQFPALKGATA